ncbi:hypothetical protein [Thermus aquaticus]|uniref:Uncharacterized protein n=1 Tax=Thermus aquaticus (strain ATCC BAA-2747 / Y51MC23) TaxID=498848 RepID=A0ABM5VJI8_THEA5|nr:hypothetical protein [Thermus aquaticus]ALJ90043.1 hypothetical protein TO73_0179 [Thermus aquaticus Y51MC23]
MSLAELVKALDEEGLTLAVEGGRPKFVGNVEAARAFLARHREEMAHYRGLLAHFLITTQDDTSEAREEFTMAYEAKLRAEAEEEIGRNVPYWLAYAFWCLLTDALSGYVRWGLERYTWAALLEAVEEGQHVGLEVRALARWARAHLAREAHLAVLRFEDPAWVEKKEKLANEAEAWAWRAWLVALAVRNRRGVSRLDPWVDLSPWVRLLAKHGRAWRLAFREEAA